MILPVIPDLAVHGVFLLLGALLYLPACPPGWPACSGSGTRR